MNPNIRSFAAPPLAYLSEKQMQDIHLAALRILEEIGTDVYHEDALVLLKNAGADIRSGNRVCMPEKLVKWAIDQAPSQIAIYDRNGRKAMNLEGCSVYFGTGSDCPSLLDSASGQKRAFLATDIPAAVKLVDALPHIDFCMSMGLGADLEETIQYQYQYAAMLRNSTKPQVIIADDQASLHDITDMAAAAVGGWQQLIEKPIFVLYTEPTSPLVHSTEAVEKLLFMAQHSLPTNYSPGIMAGATSPVTIAGAIAQATAEILAGLVMHQLKEPGAPFVFGGGLSPMDMRSMQPTFSAPEAMVAQAGLCQMGRCLYRLPTWGFGGCSAAKLADEQAVNEAATYLMMAAWTGTNLVHDIGYLEFGLTYSFELLVMCDEIIGQIKRMMEGIRVDTEHLAFDAIKRVDAGGHFLEDDHTFDHFRENWQPGITDRQTYQQWLEEGATTMGQRAQSKVQEILETHLPEALPDEINIRIDEILDRRK